MYGPAVPSFAPVVSSQPHTNDISRPPSRIGRSGAGQRGRRHSRSRNRSKPKMMIQEEELRVQSTYRSRLVEINSPPQSDNSVRSDGTKPEASAQHQQCGYSKYGPASLTRKMLMPSCPAPACEDQDRARGDRSGTPARGWRTSERGHGHRKEHTQPRDRPSECPETPAPRGRSHHRQDQLDHPGLRPDPISSRPPSRAASAHQGQSGSRISTHQQAPARQQESASYQQSPSYRGPPSQQAHPFATLASAGPAWHAPAASDSSGVLRVPAVYE